MPKEEINNTFKAVVAMLSLGKEQAASVMKHLTESEVKKLSRALISVQSVDRNIQLAVATEFQSLLRAAERMLVDGREFAREVIGEAFNEEDSEALLDLVGSSAKEPIATLISDIPVSVMDSLVQSEHPQTLAFLLSKMKPDVAATLLSRMSEEMQIDVLLRLSKLDHVKADVIDDVREVLKSQLRGISLSTERGLGGPKVAAEILNCLDRHHEARILSEIEEKVPDLAESIRNLMFTFEDIAKVDDRSIQTILKEVPRDQLVVALKTASEELKDLLLRNISQRAAELLRDDLDALGPTKLRDVEKAQQAIVDVVRRLEAEGRINILGDNIEDVLV